MESTLASSAVATGDDALSGTWLAKARTLILSGFAIIAASLALTLGWAGFAPISGAIVANGMVKVDSNRKTVQHRDGGIVQRILVREGERVAAGQPLVVLDDTRIDASYDLTRSQLDSLRLKQSRLDAERHLSAAWAVPDAYRQRAKEARIADLLLRESSLFDSRRGALVSQTQLVQQQIDEVGSEVAARAREDGSVQMAIARMQEEASVNETLMNQHYVNKTRVLQLQRNVAEYQMKLEENRAELSKARQHIAELKLKLAGLREAYVQEATSELREANDKIVDLEEQLRTADDASRRKVIAAPVAGRIVDLRIGTPGAAIGPREPVLDIVPDDSPLLVEAHVGVDAIGELHAGLPTDVRLTAYKQRSTPLIDGKVVYVSADSLVDRAGTSPYYLVHVELDRASLEKAGEVRLQPGMAAEIFVRTRERTALDYLVEPFTNAMRRAFREY